MVIDQIVKIEVDGEEIKLTEVYSLSLEICRKHNKERVRALFDTKPIAKVNKFKKPNGEA